MGMGKLYRAVQFAFLTALPFLCVPSSAQTQSDSSTDLVGVPSSGIKVKGIDLLPRALPPMVTTMLNSASCYGKRGGFSTVETDSDNLAKLQDEIDLSNSEMADPSTRMKNRYFPPNKLVNGDWSSDGTNLTVTLRLVDSHGKILLSKSSSGPVEKLFDITNGVTKELAAAMCEDKSEPTNRWAGTITYERTYQNVEKSKMPYVLGDGIDVTGKVASSLMINIRIGWTGTPQAFVFSRFSIDSEDIGTGRIGCGKAKGWRSTAFQKRVSVEKKGSGAVDANVSVTIGKSQYEISTHIPEIKVTVTSKESSHHDGGCAEPSDKNRAPIERTESVPISIPEIFEDLPPKNQNELHGSKKIANGGTMTWNLTQTPMKK